MTPAMLGRATPMNYGRRSRCSDAGLAAFHGTYQGEFSDGGGSLPVNTVLRRNGDQVTGEYYYGAGAGEVVGLIEDGTFYFQWREGNASGYDYLETTMTARRCRAVGAGANRWITVELARETHRSLSGGRRAGQILVSDGRGVAVT